MTTRRGFFKWLAGLSLGGLSLGSYATIIEPGFRLNIQTYAFTPTRWTEGLKLRVALLADPHLIRPGMTVERWQRIIATTNALQPDLILLLGDYIASHRFSTGRHTFEDVAGAAQALSAPLGRYAITGNHDWWEDQEAQRTETYGPIHATRAFEAAGIPVLENRALRLVHNGVPFWLSGTSSMIGIRRPGRANFVSRADIPAALAHVTDDAPIIHMAHEPDLFVDIPDRVSLTVSGHTHGGQVRLFGYSPIVPSMYDQRFAYGHIVEGPKHLVVSGGLGCSIMPLRFGVPPEITLLELG
jgi:uncharacterized protein